MDSMKKVSVLITNSNTRDVLRFCLQNLEKIKKEEYSELEVVVTDNSSGSDSSDMMKSEFPWVKLVVTQNNGLAAGLNSALSLASGDYYLYLGADAFLSKGTVAGLVEYFEDSENDKVGAAAVKLLLRDGSQDMDGHRGFFTPWASFTHFSGLEKLFPHSKLFTGYFLSSRDLNTEHEIDSCITHFLFVRRTTQEQVGTWDESFFLYGEDVDMCFRIKEAGWKIMYLPQFVAEHWKGVTVGRKESMDVQPKNVRYVIRGTEITKTEFLIQMRKSSCDAMELFYKKHFLGKYPFFVNFMVLFAIKVLKIFRVVKQKIENKKLE